MVDASAACGEEKIRTWVPIRKTFFKMFLRVCILAGDTQLAAVLG